MRNFTKAENDRVDFLIKEIRSEENASSELELEYDEVLYHFAKLDHPKAVQFYLEEDEVLYYFAKLDHPKAVQFYLEENVK